MFSFYANIQFGKIGLNKRPPLPLAGSINEHFYVVYLVIVVAASTMEITLHIYSIENTVRGLVIVMSSEYSPRVMLVVVAFRIRLE